MAAHRNTTGKNEENKGERERETEGREGKTRKMKQQMI